MAKDKKDDLSRKQAILAGIPYIVTKQFPWKMHELLEQVEQDGREDVVSWLPNGRAFKVHKTDIFVNEIMGSHFQQTKYKSFQRQLNLWGFERNTKECMERGSYFHPLFIRGRRDLLQDMGRHKLEQTSSALNKQAIAASSSSRSRPAAAAAAADQHQPQPPQSQLTASNVAALSTSNGSRTSSNESEPGLSALTNASAASNPSQLLSSIMAAAAAAQQQQQQQQAQLTHLHALLQQQRSTTSAAPPSSALDLLKAALLGQQQAPEPTSSSSGNQLIDALRLHHAIQKPQQPPQQQQGSGGSTLSLLQQILLGQQQQQQQVPASSTSFFSTADPAPHHHHQQQQQQQGESTRGAPSPSATTTVSHTTSGTPGNSLAQADAEVIQALQRRALLMGLMNGGGQQ